MRLFLYSCLVFLFLCAVPMPAARQYNGSSDKLTCGNAASLNGLTAISISALFYADSNSGGGVVYKGNDNNNDADEYSINVDNAAGMRIFMKVGDGNSAHTTTVTCASSWTSGSWQQVGMTYFSSSPGVGPFLAYHNGSQCGSSNAGTITLNDNSHNLLIGAAYDTSNSTFTRFWPGRIAEVAIWNTHLSAPEMAALGLGVSPNRIQAANLVGYWPLYGFGSPEPDYSGNQNNCTLTGTSLGNHYLISPPGGSF